jgi:sugar-phosphatase
VTTVLCDAVIFDLDGVLVDSRAVIERHWRRWASEVSLDFDLIMERAHGMRTIDTIRLVAPHLDAEEETARFEAVEAEDVEGVTAIAGASLLVSAVPKGSWAIVTSGPQRTAVARLRKAGLRVPDVLITAEQVKMGKPAPEGYLLAARRLGIDPAGCVVVEDAPAGIEAGRGAGMQVIAVAATHRPEELAAARFVVAALDCIEIGTRSGPPISLHLRGCDADNGG